MIRSINPATGACLAQYLAHDGSQIHDKLERAHSAQKSWARQPLAVRQLHLRDIGRLLRQNKAHLGQLITLEMGKPLAESLAEIEKCAWNFDYYAEQGPAFLSDQIIDSSASDSRVVFDPLGLVLAVMPWNYPFWQVMRAAAPILIAGNGLVLKHASNVPQCALAIEQLMQQAGLPQSLVSTLLVSGSAVDDLIADHRIAAVTFTGSTPVGQSIASAAGRALKKQVLELGGSDPFVVLADADIETAAQVAVKARFSNTGQSCISAKRFIVQQAVADRFCEAFVSAVKALVVGDPMLPSSTQGPMARVSLRDDLHAQVTASVNQGARLLTGGDVVEGPGAFYLPTVLDHVTPEMTVAREETFGPAAAIMRVDTAEQAIALANDTPFGLGASLWCGDVERARALSRQMEAGAVFINAMVASDPRLPFGGIKQSGYGRELSHWGLHEFTNIKTVWTGPNRL